MKKRHHLIKHRLLNLILAAVFLGSFLMTSTAGASNPPPTAPSLLPEEVREAFRGGMSAEEFLLKIQGPIPNALADLADVTLTVVVELEGAPVAELFSNARGNISPLAQRSQAEELASMQQPVAEYVLSHSGAVISQYTKAYNGLLVNVPYEQLDELKALPNVKAVHRAPVYYPILDNSVPTIRANKVATDLGYDGTGISIGIIDTGVDYTHAALGGSGDPDDYTNNDPAIVEPGSFPNAKVVGGWDFAGTDYTTGEVPVPDADPLDEYSYGHGTHVASTAAGLAAGDVSAGAAPGAEIYALKVYGKSGGTNLIADAIEWSMDPNGDDDLSDHLDVINISSGTTYGPADDNDPAVAAVNNAVAAGVVVVGASGNDGNVSYITGSPASASAAISVAGSNADIASPTISAPTGDYFYEPSNFDSGGHFDTEMTAALFYAGNIPSAPDDLLCDISGLDANALLGKIALIQRGTCTFAVKVNNAHSLGAVGAIIFNYEDARFAMPGDPVNIPAGMVNNTDGIALQVSHGVDITISAENDTSPEGTPENIWNNSSRGPRGFDSHLKPEITAPGTPIYAAKYKSGTEKQGYAGTSMAAPHVSGAAALVIQAHPAWTPEQVKAALMNRAIDLDDLSPVPRVGAGRVDAYESVNRDVVAVGDTDLVSLSWGVVLMGASTFSDTKTVTFTNDTAAEITYNLAWLFDGESSTAGVDFTHPVSVTVPAGGTAQVNVQLDADPTLIASDFNSLEEYSGYFVFTNTGDATDRLRLPFYLLPRPYSQLAELSSDLVMDDSINKASIELQHSGPIIADLWGCPAFVSDPDEPSIGNEGDLRLFGLDYGGLMDTDGDTVPDTDTIIPAFNVYGRWHTPQAAFAEFDLYIDVDQDGTDEYVLFNYNLGAYNGGDDNDTWMVVKKDLGTDDMTLASPFAIYTDYNAGYMEWYIPTHDATYGFGLDPVGGGGDTTFDFHVSTYDYNENEDNTATFQFDVAHPPLTWGPAAGSPTNPGPGDAETTYEIFINDVEGYDYSQPLGFMLVDYHGEPGVGQAYYWALTAVRNQIYLPFISR